MDLVKRHEKGCRSGASSARAKGQCPGAEPRAGQRVPAVTHESRRRPLHACLSRLALFAEPSLSRRRQRHADADHGSLRAGGNARERDRLGVTPLMAAAERNPDPRRSSSCGRRRPPYGTGTPSGTRRSCTAARSSSSAAVIRTSWPRSCASIEKRPVADTSHVTRSTTPIRRSSRPLIRAGAPR